MSLAVAAACLATAPARAVTIDWVTVGNAGNANDTTGYGAVGYEYKIGKYEVTIQQYTDFLNAVDPGGTNTYGLYDNAMTTNPFTKGIQFSSGSSNGFKYSPIGDASRPIASVSWFSAARFANCMHNGQGSGSTETGAYTFVGGQISGTAPARNGNAQFYVPTENEWYKAAYYSPVLNAGSGGYYTYPTQSNSVPGNLIGSQGNQANFKKNGVFSVTQAGVLDLNQIYTTAVGSYANSASFYGTFDQAGNVYEWNDLSGAASEYKGYRGGYWGNADFLLVSSERGEQQYLGSGGNGFGFRLASPIGTSVPEIDPAGMGSVLAFVGGALGLMERRRRRS